MLVIIIYSVQWYNNYQLLEAVGTSAVSDLDDEVRVTLATLMWMAELGLD